MPAEYGYIMRVLRRLESLLIDTGHQVEGGRVGLIVQRFSKSDDVRGVLAELYQVEGYDRFAMRLLYYGETVRDALSEKPDERLLEYHVKELYATLLTSSPVQEAHREKDGNAALAPGDLSRSLDEFDTGLQAMKRSAYTDDSFNGIERSVLERLLQLVNDLGEVARKERSRDIAKFSAACSTFLRFVLDRGLHKDVRVFNILDNAGLTLQTVLQAVGEENIDSLHQMVQLLEDPSTLFE